MDHGGDAPFASEALGIKKSIVKEPRHEFVRYHALRTMDSSKRGGRHGAKFWPGAALRLREIGRANERRGAQSNAN